jgi:hypothetical protein
LAHTSPLCPAPMMMQSYCDSELVIGVGLPRGLSRQSISIASINCK